MITLLRSKQAQLSITATLLMGLTGCMVGPNYKRPAVPAPPEYRGTETSANTAGETAISVGDQKWWEVFGDPQLQELIKKGLQQNYDVRVAAERVIQAQAQVRVTRSDQFPTLDGTGGFTSQKNSSASVGGGGATTSSAPTNLGSLGLSASWNLDFWGQYRRATEASRAQLLNYEWARRAVLTTVVMDIASGYFQLRSYDLQLEVSRKTLADDKESLRLTQALNTGGSSTLVAVRQAEQLVFTAQAEITELEMEIEQEEDVLCALLGESPHPILRGLALDQQPHPPTVPAGIPSELLERRPDIREAEANLMYYNAEIGVARAAYFPQISLTGSASTESNALSRLFSGPNYAWSYGPSVTVPIFNAGQIRSNVKIAESEQRQYLLTYQQTIANAFRDVSKDLIAYRKYREYREQQEQLTASAQDAVRLTQALYKEGQDSYLDVLTSETAYFSAQLNLVTAKQNELSSLVNLYNALGGGWQQ